MAASALTLPKTSGAAPLRPHPASLRPSKAASGSGRPAGLLGSRPRLLGRPGPRGAALVAAATFKVTVKLPDGSEKTFECPDDQYILDAAEEADIDLPYSCRRAGPAACS